MSEEFDGKMTVGEALRNHNGAKQIMASYHLGGCSSCAMSEEESLEEVCEGYGVDLNKLLNTLNKLISE